MYVYKVKTESSFLRNNGNRRFPFGSSNTYKNDDENNQKQLLSWAYKYVSEEDILKKLGQEPNQEVNIKLDLTDRSSSKVYFHKAKDPQNTNSYEELFYIHLYIPIIKNNQKIGFYSAYFNCSSEDTAAPNYIDENIYIYEDQVQHISNVLKKEMTHFVPEVSQSPYKGDERYCSQLIKVLTTQRQKTNEASWEKALPRDFLNQDISYNYKDSPENTHLLELMKSGSLDLSLLTKEFRLFFFSNAGFSTSQFDTLEEKYFQDIRTPYMLFLKENDENIKNILGFENVIISGVKTDATNRVIPGSQFCLSVLETIEQNLTISLMLTRNLTQEDCKNLKALYGELINCTPDLNTFHLKIPGLIKHEIEISDQDYTVKKATFSNSLLMHLSSGNYSILTPQNMLFAKLEDMVYDPHNSNYIRVQVEEKLKLVKARWNSFSEEQKKNPRYIQKLRNTTLKDIKHIEILNQKKLFEALTLILKGITSKSVKQKNTNFSLLTNSISPFIGEFKSDKNIILLVSEFRKAQPKLIKNYEDIPAENSSIKKLFEYLSPDKDDIFTALTHLNKVKVSLERERDRLLVEYKHINLSQEHDGCISDLADSKNPIQSIKNYVTDYTRPDPSGRVAPKTFSVTQMKYLLYKVFLEKTNMLLEQYYQGSANTKGIEELHKLMGEYKNYFNLYSYQTFKDENMTPSSRFGIFGFRPTSAAKFTDITKQLELSSNLLKLQP